LRRGVAAHDRCAGLARATSALESATCGECGARAGAAQLARALREHTNEALAELDLGYNEIKDQGACAIAQVGLHPIPYTLITNGACTASRPVARRRVLQC